jgi:uncharacterized protein (UPF0335 family)
LRLDGSRRRRHCGVRIQKILARSIFSGCFRWVQGGAQSKQRNVSDEGRCRRNWCRGAGADAIHRKGGAAGGEKKAIADDIREVYAEMKGCGFDVRAVREIIKIRKQDHSKRKEMAAILGLYMSALNMR